MEPADLNSPPDDTRLDAWLRQSSQLPPLPDDGFSARVVAALPASAPRRSLRPIAYIAGAFAGLAFAASQGAFTSSWSPAPGFGHAGMELWSAVSDPLFLVALTIAAVSALYALKFDEFRQLF